MPFGDREDELWEAMKPRFKPRTVGDPNIRYARHLINGTGPFAASASSPTPARDVRGTLARVVRRTPEVVVKVTGRKKGAGHLGAHLDYIGRHGDIALETRDGEQITTKADAARIADEWSDALYWRQGTTVSAVAMVFSMPAGTDPETVKQAVRDAAESLIGDNHDYVMALHTDTDRPHVHLTVQAEGLDRKRFDPRREDLFRFREAFAEALRGRGVEAEATPRYTRGEGRAGTSMALTQLRARIRSGASRQPTEADLRQAREAMQIALGKAQQPPFVSKTRDRWTETKRTFEAAAERLDRTGNREDRRLARDVRQFIQQRADIETIPDRMLRDAEKRVRDAQARAKLDQQPGRDVPRGTPPPPSRRR
ncbi:relaxase/mobilization nuclease domain-containing protein [Sphingomonas faeni]|uniref:relaxase/mobilization nuclease domain-containing protein n=1 Tax=Sphingomonas faeni TaxID=185950 RepID=UPI0020C78667|nr:relaxase/mobilization nuclease domain-containing protein [Sphingomonas faeni]MCP8892325.1 relaxase/mobilization nuclease domain-containing protein [Sphingomonas faeni]